MADDYIITYTLKLDPGDVVSASGTAGKQAGDAFGAQFKPDLSKALDIDANKLAGSVKKAFQGIDLKSDLEKTFHDWNFSKSNFGKNISDSVKSAIDKIEPTVRVPPTPAAPAGPSFAQYAQPLVSGMEAFAMLLRGAPLLSVAQMAGQAITSAAALNTARTAAAGAGGAAEHAGLPAILPMGRAAAAGAVAETAAAGAATTGAEAAAAGAAGGGLLSKIGGFSGLLRIGAYGSAVASIVGAGKSISDSIEEAGVNAAETNKRFDNMSKTMGMTRLRFNELQQSTANSGVSFDEFGSHLYRLTLNAQRMMPMIEHEVADASNKMEESNIKESRSILAVEKAHRDRAAAVDHVKIVEGELAKFQSTRADERVQEAQAATLAVTGAQVGLTGAQMQRRQADIQRQFAPAEAALADIRGPQTVEGARLGATGARIAMAEARARFEGRDPSQDEDIQDRKRRHALAVARHNVDQAELHEREAVLAEEKRQTQKAAGVGPEAQAEQQARAAAQAEQQAQLHVAQTQTAQTNLKFRQEANTLQMESNDMERKVLQAKADQVESLYKTPEIEAVRAAREKKEFPMRDIETVQKFLGGREGVPEGFDFTKVLPDTFRKAFFREAEFDPDKIQKLAHTFFTAQEDAGVPRAQQLARFSQLFQTRGIGGKSLEEELSMFQKPEAQLTDAQRARQRQMAEKETAAIPVSERITAKKEESELAKRNRDLEFGLAAGTETRKIQDTKFISKFTDYLKLQGIDYLTAAPELMGFDKPAPPKVIPPPTGPGRFEELRPETVAPVTPRLEELNVKPPDLSGIGEGAKSAIDGAGTSASGAITGAGDNVAGALNSVASKIGAVQISSPSASPLPKGREGTESIATEQAQGGPIHGAGTGTSDSIPANLSAGEFVVTADGGNLKDAISYFGMRGFAEGGAVGEKGDLGTWGAIIKSSQWGAWLAKMGLPAIGVAIPAAVDTVLARANPAISAALALKAVWDETHEHPPMTLGEVLKEQRGGQSVNEMMAQHFAENRQATFDERFAAAPPAADTFDDRFGFQAGGHIPDGAYYSNGILVDKNGNPVYPNPGLYKTTSSFKQSSTKTGAADIGGGGGGGSQIMPIRIMPIRIATGAAPSATPTYNPNVDTGDKPRLFETSKSYATRTGIKDDDPNPRAGESREDFKKRTGVDSGPGFDELQAAARIDSQDFAAGGLVGMAEGGSIDERAYADPRGEGATDERAFLEPRGRRHENRISAADFARFKQQRRGFQAGGAVSEGEFAKLSAPAVPDEFVQHAMADLSRKMVSGFVEPIASNFSSASAQMMRGGGGAGMPAGYHQLDLLTSMGRISTAVSEDTVVGLQQRAVAGKMTSTGPRPTWYS